MKIEVNGLITEIKEVEHCQLVEGTGKDACGAYFFRIGEIWIEKGLEINAFKRTLIHEITHSVLEANGFSFKDRYSEEDLCEIIASHGEQIINITNRYMKEVKGVEE